MHFTKIRKWKSKASQEKDPSLLFNNVSMFLLSSPFPPKRHCYYTMKNEKGGKLIFFQLQGLVSLLLPDTDILSYNNFVSKSPFNRHQVSVTVLLF